VCVRERERERARERERVHGPVCALMCVCVCVCVCVHGPDCALTWNVFSYTERSLTYPVRRAWSSLFSYIECALLNRMRFLVHTN
jgi:hypothetical protein